MPLGDRPIARHVLQVYQRMKIMSTQSDITRNRKNFCAILFNIRSAHNVGSIFRTADGAGVAKLYLCGYTPTPNDRNVGKDISKTALGAETFVLWEKHRQTVRLIKKLKKEGARIVALEQTPNSILYSKFKPKFPLCLIVGNEVSGIPKSILSLADDIIEIPMQGKKESLNVAVAFGIAAYNLAKQVLKKS